MTRLKKSDQPVSCNGGSLPVAPIESFNGPKLGRQPSKRSDSADSLLLLQLVRVEDINTNLPALNRASIDGDTLPFAAFIAERVRWSLDQAKGKPAFGKFSCG